MDIDQVARRAATRRNNKTRREIPLLADFFLTDAETEKRRIERQRAASEIYLARLRALDAQMWREGEVLMELASFLVPAAVFWAKAHFFNDWMPKQGAYLADFWGGVLRENDRETAADPPS